MWLSVNMQRVVEFLVGLLETPSPTGYHEEAMRYVRERFGSLGLEGLELRETNKGALVCTWPGASDDALRAVSAHVDTLGAMVREIKANGRLLMTQIGGYAWQSVEGENVTVISVGSGTRHTGTVQTVSPSVHTSDDAEKGKREDERMEVRLDARVSKREETEALGIEVGDLIAFAPRVAITPTGYVKSRHLDDKAGVAVIYGALMTMRDLGLRPAQTTSFFISNYEEVGHGASAGIPAAVKELLVIDMAAATTGEHQNSDEYSVGICAKDSSGPYDLAVRQRLTRLCREHQIPHKVDTFPHYGSDGSALLRAGGDVRVGLIGPGVDASHAYERTHRDSLDATISLLIRYLLDPAE